MLYESVGELGDVNESVLMNANVNERAEVDNVSHGTVEHHIGLEVLDAHNVVAKRRRREAVSDVSSGLLKLGDDVVKRGCADAAFRADLRRAVFLDSVSKVAKLTCRNVSLAVSEDSKQLMSRLVGLGVNASVIKYLLGTII